LPINPLRVAAFAATLISWQLGYRFTTTYAQKAKHRTAK
jgi:hypothetical protein